MKDAARVIKDVTKRARTASLRTAQQNFEDARRRGTCNECISNGQDFDSCGEPAVVRVESGLLCASCAEDRINALERRLAAVREAVK